MTGKLWEQQEPEVQACTFHLATGVIQSFPTPPAKRPPTPPTDMSGAEAAGAFDFNVPRC